MRQFIGTIQQVISEAEKDKVQSQASNSYLDKKAITVFLLLPFCLTMIYYVGQYKFMRMQLLDIGWDGTVSKLDNYIISSSGSDLRELTYWVCCLNFFYFVIPALAIKFFLKEKLSDYGLRLKGAFTGYPIYIVMLLFMLPLVLYFSTTKGFQSKYPFLNMYPGDHLYPDFWIWEILYCSQFFALEFFFRGFVLFGLKPKFGFYSVFIMTVPYCMIHFGKPLPETLAAIIAGVVLGWLSLKNKSVWLGFLIHCSVGLSMDLASLWQKGFFD